MSKFSRTTLSDLMWEHPVTCAVILATILAAVFVGNHHSFSATYCDYSGTECVYQDKAILGRSCPEYWDRSSFFEKANNYKLKEGTCEVRE